MQRMRQPSGSFSRYFAINDSLFSGQIYLTGAGRAVIPAGHPYPPPGHPDLYQFRWADGRVLPEFSLLLVEQGEGVWETADGVFPIGGGDVGRVTSGKWHRYRPNPATGWTECWIQFNGRLAHELAMSGQWDAARPVGRPTDPLVFARHFGDFMRDLGERDFVNTPAQGLRVAGLIGLLGCPDPQAVVAGHGLVDKAREHIWGHSHRQLNVPEIAASLGVGRRTLERAFAAAGIGSVLDEITRCRLHRAERLLRETLLPIQHVVNLSGFGTPEQMRLNFQAKHGIAPAAYRKSILRRTAGPVPRDG